MTTQLTTNNPVASVAGSDLDGTAFNSSPPSNFPDEATLAKLANEFFSALPSSGGSQGLNLDLPNFCSAASSATTI